MATIGEGLMEWISAEERLPEEHGLYLVITTSYPEILFFNGKKGAVKFWMPLPKCPIGIQEDEIIPVNYAYAESKKG